MAVAQVSSPLLRVTCLCHSRAISGLMLGQTQLQWVPFYLFSDFFPWSSVSRAPFLHPLLRKPESFISSLLAFQSHPYGAEVNTLLGPSLHILNLSESGKHWTVVSHTDASHLSLVYLWSVPCDFFLSVGHLFLFLYIFDSRLIDNKHCRWHIIRLWILLHSFKGSDFCSSKGLHGW